MLRRVLLIVLGMAFVAAPSALAQSKAQTDRGAKVYAESKCSVCHSVADQGNKKGPLDAVGSKLGADEIRQWIVTPKEMTEKTKADRKPPMKAFANLPKDDLDALVAYLGTLKKK
jgi:mono/diheme cytochrome c family protein